MRTLVFSICASNYIGLARVLGQSIEGQADFRIYVADAEDSADAPAPDLFSAAKALESIISPTEFANMAFMYNVTEFCTALKAACFMHAFEAGYDRVIYADPDVFFIGELSAVTQALESCEILVTPHLCLPSNGEGPRPDHGILATGVYNLGFLGLRCGPSSRAFLQWWHERLRTQAFNDHYRSLFTDQRWMDFVPSLFPSDAVRIWRHLGCNLAPWNFHERRVQMDEGRMVVRPRTTQPVALHPDPLVFVHFSGFDFRAILGGEFDQRNLVDARHFDDLTPVYGRYAAAIQDRADEFERHLAMPYRFDSFADGTLVLPSQRRLFRIWRERHGDAYDPFATGARTFHEALRSRGLTGRSGSADMAADKHTVRTIERPDRLLARSRTVSRIMYRLLGRARFFLLVRGLNRLAHVEQHFDTFALDEADVRSTAVAEETT